MEPRSHTSQVDSLLSEPPGKPKWLYFSNLAYDYIFLKKFLEDEWMSFFLIAGAHPTKLLYSWLYWTTCFFLEIPSSLSFCHPVSVVFLSDLPISGFSIDWPWHSPLSIPSTTLFSFNLPCYPTMTLNLHLSFSFSNPDMRFQFSTWKYEPPSYLLLLLLLSRFSRVWLCVTP